MEQDIVLQDPIRQEFIEMYEEMLIESLEENSNDSLSEEEDRTLRINAMVDTALRVRKDLDPLLANKLKSLENLKDYKQYLLSEFRLFGFIPKSHSAKVFAEYLLMSLLDEFEVEERVNFEVFGNMINEAFSQTAEDYQDLKRIFPWGALID